MKTIWKYPIPFIYELLTLEIPIGAEVLTIQMQNGVPTLWAIVDPNATKERHVFRIVGTGNLFDPEGMKYAGTFQDVGGFVWHVWRVNP